MGWGAKGETLKNQGQASEGRKAIVFFVTLSQGGGKRQKFQKSCQTWSGAKKDKAKVFIVRESMPWVIKKNQDLGKVGC